MRIEKGLIYKYSNLIFTNEELKKRLARTTKT